MSIRVVRHMLPNQKPVSGAEFIAMSPPCSLAFDGFCKEGPWLNKRLRRANLNHHEGCMRFATHSTAKQALDLVRTDWRSVFRDADGPLVHLYENDDDQDVCGADFAFKYVHLVENVINPLVNRYYAITDVMDRYGGAYPYPPDLEMLEAHTWTVVPYLNFRRSGGLDRTPRNPDEFESVVDDVGRRIKAHILGQGERVALDDRYKILQAGTQWSLVREIGMSARLRMYSEKIRNFVSVRERPDGRLAATVGTFDLCSLISVPRILEAWNQEDGLGPDDDRHGGSDTIGGTSRKNGTKMSLDRLFKVTEEAVQAELATYSF